MSTNSPQPHDPASPPKSESASASETTRPVDTSGTRPHQLPTAEPEHGGRYEDDEQLPAEAPVVGNPGEPGVAGRPKGVSWPTVVFGTIALAVGTLVLGLQTLDLAIDWSFVVPAAIVGVGALLIVVGVVGLFSRREDEPPRTP